VVDLQNRAFAKRAKVVIGRQVHGTRVLSHSGGWEGFLRTEEADGHIRRRRESPSRFLIADLRSDFHRTSVGCGCDSSLGWRGTASRIIDSGLAEFARRKLPPDELMVHLGPAICGRCYEVSADVRAQLTGETANRPGNVDLRSLLAEHAHEAEC
jgi:copper oxidase (laccase) domain-containing protein